MQVFSFWKPTHSRSSIDIFVESPSELPFQLYRLN